MSRLTAQSHSLTLRDAQGETQVVRISSLDSSWSLFRPEKMPVADGERLRVTGKIPGLRVSGGDRLQVASVSEDAMTVVVPGLPACERFTIHGTEAGERLGGNARAFRQ